jgi:hypothetical protein
MECMADTPLIVNLFGAPGAGKSTCRAHTFALLKRAGLNIEETTEFAKDLTWEKRTMALSCQPYVFGKQLRNMERLFGQVDVIITDSPLLLSRYYGEKYCGDRYHESFYKFVTEQFKKMGGLNYYINRVRQYNPKGRNQTEEESNEIAGDLRQLLMRQNLRVRELDGNENAPQKIFEDVLRHLTPTTANPDNPRLVKLQTCPHGGPYITCPDCP